MHIKVKVHTKARKERIEKISEEKLEVHIKEKPENNVANRKLLFLLSEYFKVSQGDVKIIKGHHSPNKIIFVNQA